MEVTECELRRWLQHALWQVDARTLAAQLPQVGQGMLQVHMQATQRLRNRLKLPADLHGALLGVQRGDVITNAIAKHWNGGQASCRCGETVETLHHCWWRCPDAADLHKRILGIMCPNNFARTLHPATRLYGLATRCEAVDQWRRALVCTQLQAGEGMFPPWLKEFFTDASGLHSKDPEVKVVGWGAV